MILKQEVVAMLLAGGQGSRLGNLTEKVAKPAVPFGGKYRIIDFPLSNCINSGIEAVGVLTQYQPLVLNEYIGNGQPWDLDVMHAGIQILSPYQKIGGADWYCGTANAIYQNLDYINRYNPDYVLILSGDHIYKMDYSKMLYFHKKRGATCTIASINVPKEEASRFGILRTDDLDKILEFYEKPKNPISTKASMGVYIFNWETLRKYLIEDNKNDKSSHDFGKDVIPFMLHNGEKLYAYPYSGYWKDVGTLESLWEANIDLLTDSRKIDLSDNSWEIYSGNPVVPPSYIASGAKISNSIVSEGCNIYGNIDFSVVFPNVEIGKNSTVRNTILMPGATIGENCVIEYSIIAEDAVIGDNVIIGGTPSTVRNDWGLVVVGSGRTVGSNMVIKPNSIIDKDIGGGQSERE